MEPINYELIFNYGIRMTLALTLSLLLYLIRVAQSHIATIDWLKSNAVRIALGYSAAWTLAGAIVISPEISQLLGGLGFNAEQSPAAMAIVIAGMVIGVTSKPAAEPVR